jgi:hypothetical protein
LFPGAPCLPLGLLVRMALLDLKFQDGYSIRPMRGRSPPSMIVADRPAGTFIDVV